MYILLSVLLGLIPVGILDLLNTLHSKPNAFAGLIAALGNQALFPDRMVRQRRIYFE